MGTQQVLNTSPERDLHIQLMREIARDFQDLPMVLKGGTALLLCYGLDRFSEDLDFDAPKPFNILPRVERVLSRNVHSYLVKIVKDTCYLLISDRIFYLFSIITKSKNKGVFTTFAS